MQRANLEGVTGADRPFSDSEPAVVGTSAVLKLSLTISGTQCSGPTKPDCANLVSRTSATAKAFGLTIMIALRTGPFLVVRLDAIDVVFTHWIRPLLRARYHLHYDRCAGDAERWTRNTGP